jgi:hypothetical protein
MRFTLTLDPDVARSLKDAMRRSGQSFKETINAVLRSSLGRTPAGSKATPFVVEARPMGLRAGIDMTRLNALSDDLEMNEPLAQPRRAKRP